MSRTGVLFFTKVTLSLLAINVASSFPYDSFDDYFSPKEKPYVYYHHHQESSKKIEEPHQTLSLGDFYEPETAVYYEKPPPTYYYEKPIVDYHYKIEIEPTKHKSTQVHKTKPHIQYIRHEEIHGGHKESYKHDSYVEHHKKKPQQKPKTKKIVKPAEYREEIIGQAFENDPRIPTMAPENKTTVATTTTTTTTTTPAPSSAAPLLNVDDFGADVDKELIDLSNAILDSVQKSIKKSESKADTQAINVPEVNQKLKIKLWYEEDQDKK